MLCYVPSTEMYRHSFMFLAHFRADTTNKTLNLQYNMKELQIVGQSMCPKTFETHQKHCNSIVGVYIYKPPFGLYTFQCGTTKFLFHPIPYYRVFGGDYQCNIIS